jgi:hypothetical protein
MYSDIIKQATGCDEADAKRIEEFMRDVIFRSTLDWQTTDQLTEAARLAQQALKFQREQQLANCSSKLSQQPTM